MPGSRRTPHLTDKTQREIQTEIVIYTSVLRCFSCVCGGIKIEQFSGNCSKNIVSRGPDSHTQKRESGRLGYSILKVK